MMLQVSENVQTIKREMRRVKVFGINGSGGCDAC